MIETLLAVCAAILCAWVNTVCTPLAASLIWATFVWLLFAREEWDDIVVWWKDLVRRARHR